MTAIAILLILIIGLILFAIMPDDDIPHFEDEVMPFRTDGEWSDKQ